jgi:hypothetical protein
MAEIITTLPKMKGVILPSLYNIPPTKKAANEPKPPIRLITPLALLRCSEGKRSPSRAMTGERNYAMVTLVSKIANIIPTGLRISGTMMKNKAARGRQLPSRFATPKAGAGAIRTARRSPLQEHVQVIIQVIKNRCCGRKGEIFFQEYGYEIIENRQMRLMPKKPKPSRKVLR